MFKNVPRAALEQEMLRTEMLRISRVLEEVLVRIGKLEEQLGEQLSAKKRHG